jgi:hypothetical protein
VCTIVECLETASLHYIRGVRGSQWLYTPSVAAGLRTVGVITTCQRINDVNWKRPDRRSIAGGVLADGLGCAIGEALGVSGWPHHGTH